MSPSLKNFLFPILLIKKHNFFKNYIQAVVQVKCNYTDLMSSAAHHLDTSNFDYLLFLFFEGRRSFRKSKQIFKIPHYQINEPPRTSCNTAQKFNRNLLKIKYEIHCSKIHWTTFPFVNGIFDVCKSNVIKCQSFAIKILAQLSPQTWWGQTLIITSFQKQWIEL